VGFDKYPGPPRLLFSYSFQLGLLKLAFYSNTLSSAVISFNHTQHHLKSPASLLVTAVGE
jgi:hypothetical protein